MSIAAESPSTKDVERAKRAVWWDDEVDDDLAGLFPPSNDPTLFSGDRSDLSAIRSAMKRFEEQEAAIMQDKAFYDSRRRLQFVEVDDE